MGYLVDLSNDLLKMLCFEFLSNVCPSQYSEVYAENFFKT